MSQNIDKQLEQAVIQITAMNPCLTNDQVLEIVAEEMRKQKKAVADGTFEKAIDLSRLSATGYCDG
jgi:hypothetical protein